MIELIKSWIWGSENSGSDNTQRRKNKRSGSKEDQLRNEIIDLKSLFIKHAYSCGYSGAAEEAEILASLDEEQLKIQLNITRNEIKGVRNTSGDTLLMLEVAGEADPENIKLLIDAGIDVNHVPRHFGGDSLCALWYAAGNSSCSVNVLKALKDAGAAPRPNELREAFIQAVKSNSVEKVKFLHKNYNINLNEPLGDNRIPIGMLAPLSATNADIENRYRDGFYGAARNTPSTNSKAQREVAEYIQNNMNSSTSNSFIPSYNNSSFNSSSSSNNEKSDLDLLYESYKESKNNRQYYKISQFVNEELKRLETCWFSQDKIKAIKEAMEQLQKSVFAIDDKDAFTTLYNSLNQNRFSWWQESTTTTVKNIKHKFGM